MIYREIEQIVQGGYLTLPLGRTTNEKTVVSLKFSVDTRNKNLEMGRRSQRCPSKGS